tara:strand:+ start:929 stop:1060 length:132 start_codon:yes stop_codon:yes gene_type:complete
MIPIWKKIITHKKLKRKLFSLSSKMINEGELTYNIEKKISKIK